MIDRQKALGLINELVDVEVLMMKQIYSGRARSTKAADERERKAIHALFVALVGDKPTPEELSQMVSG